MGRRLAPMKKLQCPMCDIMFEVKDIKRNRDRKFCSGFCAKTANGKANRGRKHTAKFREQKRKQMLENNPFKGKTHTAETRAKISKANTGKKHTAEANEKKRQWMLKNNPFKGKKHTIESRKKMGRDVSGTKNPMYGKRRSDVASRNKNNKGWKQSEEAKQKISETLKGRVFSKGHKRKQRLAAIARIERSKGQVNPNYSPEACRLIDEYGKQNGYNFQHAETRGEFHIKELGFWVDGYDAKKNVVIEVDESRHYTNSGKLKKKDVERQKEITEHLGCTFIRIRI